MVEAGLCNHSQPGESVRDNFRLDHMAPAADCFHRDSIMKLEFKFGNGYLLENCHGHVRRVDYHMAKLDARIVN